jgi:hypothetical protein
MEACFAGFLYIYEANGLFLNLRDLKYNADNDIFGPGKDYYLRHYFYPLDQRHKWPI